VGPRLHAAHRRLERAGRVGHAAGGRVGSAEAGGGEQLVPQGGRIFAGVGGGRGRGGGGAGDEVQVAEPQRHRLDALPRRGGQRLGDGVTARAAAVRIV
jgi:hypothetical protein